MNEPTIIYNRMRFWDLFDLAPEGYLLPKKVLSIGGITFGPGVGLKKGNPFSGVDIFDHLNEDVAVIKEDGVYNVKGFYSPTN